MDGQLNGHPPAMPVTLALAGALDESGDLYRMARYLADMNAEDKEILQPLRVVVMEILTAISDMGAVYRDHTGRHRIDVQAMVDFGVVHGGLSPGEVMYGRSLRQIALMWRQAGLGTREDTSPDRDFMREMLERFPDRKEEP